MENKGCPIADDWLDCLANTVPSPNDLVLDLSEETVFLNLIRANACEHETVSASHLSVALQCGGSDSFSSITANPSLGENQVPSTKEPDPYMHIFLDAGGGNILAFFELPNSPDMCKDPNTPEWVQHIAFEVEGLEVLTKTKARLEANGIDVVGITNHTIFKSIYFFDPSGHRIELATNTNTPEMSGELDNVKWDMLNEWSKTKIAPEHARWMHSGTFD